MATCSCNAVSARSAISSADVVPGFIGSQLARKTVQLNSLSITESLNVPTDCVEKFDNS